MSYCFKITILAEINIKMRYFYWNCKNHLALRPPMVSGGWDLRPRHPSPLLRIPGYATGYMPVLHFKINIFCESQLKMVTKICKTSNKQKQRQNLSLMPSLSIDAVAKVPCDRTKIFFAPHQQIYVYRQEIKNVVVFEKNAPSIPKNDDTEPKVRLYSNYQLKSR